MGAMPYDKAEKCYYVIGHPGTTRQSGGKRIGVAYDKTEYDWMERVSKGRIERFPWAPWSLWLRQICYDMVAGRGRAVSSLRQTALFPLGSSRVTPMWRSCYAE